MSDTLQTMSTEMESTQCIENLPDDILVEILSYLSFEDLIHSVYHVSSRFQDVSQDSHLWRKLQYNPAYNETDADVVNILQQIPKIQILNLEELRAQSRVLYSSLENCSNLRKLTFGIHQTLGEQLVKSMVLKCEKLEHLTISDASLITLEAVEMIGQLQKLRTLNIVGLINSSHLVSLRPIGDGCPLLQHLDIQNLSITTADLKYFMELKRHQLQSITVRCLTIDRECTIPYLTVCKTLKKVTIDCYLNNVDSTAKYETLRSMKNITSLSFIGVRPADVNSLANLFSNKEMSHVIELEFKFFLGYDDRMCEIICNNCPLLKVLSFMESYSMTYRELESLQKLKQLEYLLLSSFECTDKAMNLICKCKSLKYLGLPDCTDLTEQCVSHLMNLNLLETFQIDYCNIKGFPLRLIPSLLTNLRLFSINYCDGDNLEGLPELRAEMPHLLIRTVEKEFCNHSEY